MNKHINYHFTCIIQCFKLFIVHFKTVFHSNYRSGKAYKMASTPNFVLRVPSESAILCSLPPSKA